MKERNGFVSNSSSSSFILSSKTDKVSDLNLKVMVELDLNKFEDDIVVVKNKKELDDYIEEYYTDKSKIYDELMDILENGNTLFFGDANNQSWYEVERHICNFGFSQTEGDIEIIQDCEGY